MRLSLRFTALLRQVISWLAPQAPEAIRVEVERRQLARIQRYVPMIYVIASLNTLIAMAVCAHSNIDPRAWTWMFVLVIVALVRTKVWLRTRRVELSPAAVSLALKRSAWFGVASLVGLGGFATSTYVFGVFFRSPLIPISLAFGSMSIAHCFATLRPSAVTVICLGIVPTSVAMLIIGDFDARVLGVMMLSVAVLMITFVSGQYDQLVTEVQLQREVHDLANTDALTNLLNRRALVGVLERELTVAGNSFAIALLDLDGFKGVNDRLGHLTGDLLLKVVAKRLASSCGTSGTVGRLGGDEFLVVFHSIHDLAEVEARVATLLGNLCQPTELSNESVMVQASLGFSLFPRDGVTTAELLAAADEALYANKRERTQNAAALEESKERRRHRLS